MTQAQLAERAGVGRRFVNELETGHSTLFVDRLAAVLRELGIRVVLETGPTEGAAHGVVRVSGHAEGETHSPVKDLGW
ncbi:helix-turn-helix domain-containing protein [Agilicoccus flavus]|uniref:helix-turn-helix domain-containing protein n=1 Tax=Agilicoccus flavus TaxID=2775968 RepID=UPI001CF63946|nr:helix-turn-helix domain-containing protein [Agilicoccus flavus]